MSASIAVDRFKRKLSWMVAFSGRSISVWSIAISGCEALSAFKNSSSSKTSENAVVPCKNTCRPDPPCVFARPITVTVNHPASCKPFTASRKASSWSSITNAHFPQRRAVPGRDSAPSNASDTIAVALTSASDHFEGDATVTAHSGPSSSIPRAWFAIVRTLLSQTLSSKQDSARRSSRKVGVQVARDSSDPSPANSTGTIRCWKALAVTSLRRYCASVPTPPST